MDQNSNQNYLQDNNLDDQSDDQNNQSGANQADDGTLDLQPQTLNSPEGTIFLKTPEFKNIKIENNAESAPKPTESQPTQQEQQPIQEAARPAETISTPETEQIPETLAPQQEPIVEEPIQNIVQQPQNPPVEETPNIVDLRTGHENLHNVEPEADKFTAQADEEEQKFIQEVEKHHEHK